MLDPRLMDAYFAGLIDGEAHITLTQRSPTSFRPVVVVEMTCEKTIRALHTHFGVGTVRFLPRRKEHHKDQWQWRTLYTGAREVLRRVRPFLITKAVDADVVISHVGVGRGRRLKSEA
jgi:hypothetical protein